MIFWSDCSTQEYAKLYKCTKKIEVWCSKNDVWIRSFLFLIFPIFYDIFLISIFFLILGYHQCTKEEAVTLAALIHISNQIQWVQARIANVATNAARTRSNRFNQTTLNHGLETRNYQVLQSRFGNQPGGCQNCIFKSHLQVRNFGYI